MNSENIIRKIEWILEKVRGYDWGRRELKYFIVKELRKIIKKGGLREMANDYYSHRIIIKKIDNGWLVRYNVIKQVDTSQSYEYRKFGEQEKAFIYEYPNNKIKAWKDLVKFITEEIKKNYWDEEIAIG